MAQTYSYDRYGNRTNVTASGVAADGSSIPGDGIPNLSYNTTTNRITTAGFEYDTAGNQTRALAEDGVSWLRFEYDAANRLRVVKRDDGTSVQAFEYGSTNARVASWDYASSQLTIYAGSGGTVLSEYTEFAANIPTWTKSFTYLGDSALSTITPNGQGGEYTEYNHPDRLGTRVISNQQSGTSYEQAALPFGTALNAESTISTNKKRFTSYDRSERTGLDYAVNRTYDSKQGRFTQVDPIGMSAASLSAPQTLNLYTYCGNDPINHTDPSGLFWGFIKKLFKWVMVAIAVIVAIITIVSAPATIAGILGAISAGANAAAQVLNAAGFKKIGMIFGLIAIATGFGSIIAGKIGRQHFRGSASESGAGSDWSQVFNGVGSVANSLRSQKEGKRKSSNLDVCDHWIKFYYSLLKPHFDKLWEKTQNTKSEEAPNGKEAGGVIYISNSKVSIGGIEENGIDMYDGETYKDGMGDDFDNWQLERRRVRGLRDYVTLVVHTHPSGVGKPSGPGDYGKASNSPEAVVGLNEISVYNGKKILCTIKR